MTCTDCLAYEDWTEQNVYHGNMPQRNKEVLRGLLARLHDHAVPDNHAWNELVYVFNHQPDHSPADHGETYEITE